LACSRSEQNAHTSMSHTEHRNLDGAPQLSQHSTSAPAPISSSGSTTASLNCSSTTSRNSGLCETAYLYRFFRTNRSRATRHPSYSFRDDSSANASYALRIFRKCAVRDSVSGPRP